MGYEIASVLLASLSPLPDHLEYAAHRRRLRDQSPRRRVMRYATSDFFPRLDAASYNGSGLGGRRWGRARKPERGTNVVEPGPKTDSRDSPEPPIDPERWLDDHGDALYRYALKHGVRRDAAEDLVQECFLAGLRAQERFEGGASERTWLMSILRHKIIDHIRRGRRPASIRNRAWRKTARPATSSAGSSATTEPGGERFRPGRGRPTQSKIASSSTFWTPALNGCPARWPPRSCSARSKAKRWTPSAGRWRSPRETSASGFIAPGSCSATASASMVSAKPPTNPGGPREPSRSMDPNPDAALRDRLRAGVPRDGRATRIPRSHGPPRTSSSAGPAVGSNAN